MNNPFEEKHLPQNIISAEAKTQPRIVQKKAIDFNDISEVQSQNTTTIGVDSFFLPEIQWIIKKAGRDSVCLFPYLQPLDSMISEVAD